ncbi:MAG: FtsX-like permease family protein [Bdellovibrionota bacterium]
MPLAWELFKHYLLGRRAGSLIRRVAWLCMAGVAMGVLSLVVVISVMNGFNDSIRQRLLAVEPHLMVQIPGLETANQIRTSSMYQFLSARPGTQTQLYETQDVILRTVDGLFDGAIARGVEPVALKFILEHTRSQLSTAEMVGSNGIETPPIDEETATLGPGEVLVGIDLARSLGIFEGDKLTIIAPEALLLPAGEAPPFERVTVKSLLTTNLPDIDSKVVFYGQAQSLGNLSRSIGRQIGIEVRTDDPESIEELKAEVVKRGGQAQSWIDRNSTLFYALRMEKFAIGVFLSLAALIASFSIVTVLILLLTQKRKDIGLLMGLGLSPKQTRNIFVQLGMILSTMGIMTGLISGVVISLVIDNYRIPILPEVYYDATIPARVDPVFVTVIFVVSLIVAYLSAWIPANTTTKESPADALRSVKLR